MFAHLSGCVAANVMFATWEFMSKILGATLWLGPASKHIERSPFNNQLSAKQPPGMIKLCPSYV